MGFTAKQLAFSVAVLGLVSFILGVLAENKKPPSGTPIPGKGVVICSYPSDPSVVLGSLSFVFLVAATAVGFASLFYPYKGLSIPQYIMFKDSTFVIFFNITVFTTGLGAALLLWPIIEERKHLNNKVHHDPSTTCPTAKTGLLGGGAFCHLIRLCCGW
ncbi:hypothetical protein FNV43_RR11202 [Rhamnella rubrinervis]|uniref:NADH dehydrogenase subunit 6 n=1 Tax=Rhamnella rubrinervis TaxID=2594499 RepID=A0A8K0H5P7_9ROSA|nr:hypothetical protein FNV43_RR11202 [Rhamnella rubrinervis]